MNKYRLSLWIAVPALLVPLFGLPFSRALAASPSSTDAIRVSPALSNVQLSAGETSTTIVTTVTNLTSAPLTISVAARDFGASETNSSTIGLFGSGYDPATNPHGLQTAINLTNTPVMLAPYETQKIPIVLNSVDKLAPGGHYGAILFSPVPTAIIGKQTKVSIHSSVASLIFLKTASGGTQMLQLIPFSVSPVRFSLPSTNLIAFKDIGNTQSAPQGQLTLYGPSGSIISTEVVNPGSGLILPGTSRLFTIGLPFSHTWMERPGVYRIELQYRDSSQNIFTVVDKRFYYINLMLILPLFVFICLMIVVFRQGGKKLLQYTKRAVSRFIHFTKNKRAKPVPPEKPKRKPPLIQG